MFIPSCSSAYGSAPVLADPRSLRPAPSRHAAPSRPRANTPPRNWPFQPSAPDAPRPQAEPAQQAEQAVPTLAGLTGPASVTLSRGAMIADVAMVLAWGGIIPTLMWLGHAAGF
ncbi:hypothetical protein AMB3_1505 [plant metagenome]